MKVWFITGTSKGFGRIWAQAALARGDKVAATARDERTLSELVERHGQDVLPLRLDVTDRGAVGAAVRRAHEHFGRLDVVVNNAGYGLFGTVEEVSEAQARAQVETNLFGALWVTQAALPIQRAQGSGHIIQVSSIAGVQAFPTLGLYHASKWALEGFSQALAYHASKWALEGFSQALAAEVRDFGINVTIVEPTGYNTDWSGPSSVHAAPLAAYDALRAGADAAFGAVRTQRGDPQATAAAILDVVDADEPPLRIFLGTGLLDMIRAEYEQRIATWEQWDDVSQSAHGALAQ
jgi:NAD(P)-dependent dehydrogenase (short-subunit alcohol dehydrogenase family)